MHSRPLSLAPRYGLWLAWLAAAAGILAAMRFTML